MECQLSQNMLMGKIIIMFLDEKLYKLLEFITFCEPAASGKVCVDSSQILEKASGKRSRTGLDRKKLNPY